MNYRCAWLGLMTVIVAAPAAVGHPNYVTAFQSAYPSSTLVTRMGTAAGQSCFVCHQPNGNNYSRAGNCYRMDLKARIDAGRTVAQAIADVDQMDSDGDGVSNHDEILWVRTDLPGQVGYNPGLIGATGTDACAPAAYVTVAVTQQRETPCRADYNRMGGVTVQDIFDFLNGWLAGNAAANFNGGPLDVQDIFDFLNEWMTGC
jgi:hypothetical protein